MTAEFADDYRHLVELQRGVLARWQAPAAGMTPSLMKSRLQSGRWRAMYRGVYATFTGPSCREARLWAAVLRTGPGAVLSHQTAAELDRLTDKPSSLIHVMVPGEQHVAKIPGICVHRSRRLTAARHPSRVPPRTRIEETVLDLTQIAESFDVAFSWLCLACGSRLTTPARLLSGMAARRQLRWREYLREALADISSGTHSPLEVR